MAQTWRFLFGNKSASVSRRIGHGLGIGLGMQEIGELILGLISLLPSESGAEKRKRFSGSGRRLEQCVAMTVSVSSIESGDDPAHECQLGTVRVVRELHLDASNLVPIFGGFSARVRVSSGSCRHHFWVLWCGNKSLGMKESKGFMSVKMGGYLGGKIRSANPFCSFLYFFWAAPKLFIYKERLNFKYKIRIW